jgi:hypothetical protein
MALTAPTRTRWAAPLRVFDGDERLFAVILAIVIVRGLTALGLVPLRPRHRVDVTRCSVGSAATTPASSRW